MMTHSMLCCYHAVAVGMCRCPINTLALPVPLARVFAKKQLYILECELCSDTLSQTHPGQMSQPHLQDIFPQHPALSGGLSPSCRHRLNQCHLFSSPKRFSPSRGNHHAPSNFAETPQRNVHLNLGNSEHNGGFERFVHIDKSRTEVRNLPEVKLFF